MDEKQEEDHAGQPVYDMRVCDGLPRVCFTLWSSYDTHWAEYVMGLTLSFRVSLCVISKGNLEVYCGIHI